MSVRVDAHMNKQALKILGNLDQETAKRLTTAVASLARKKAPVGEKHKRTVIKSGTAFARKDGTERDKVLRRSIRGVVKLRKGTGGRKTGSFYGKVYTTDNKGGLIEKGTGLYGSRKHMITPKHGRFMYFTVGGRLVRAKAVRGRKPTPFLAPAVKEVFANLGRYLSGMVK